VTHTLEVLRDWLADDSQFDLKHTGVKSANGLNFAGVRYRFRLGNGKRISIQQSALHHCTVDSVELFQCPHSSLLAPYDSSGKGRGTYARVPLHVVVDYLNEQEKL
jgi:hypothetical protein